MIRNANARFFVIRTLFAGRGAFLAVAILIAAALPALGAAAAPAFTPDADHMRDRAALDELQRDAFRFMWENADPDSGMAYEANYDWKEMSVTTGGTGFGIAAIVVATDREWISREQAVSRLLKIARFLHDKSPRRQLHGAFPHWMNGRTGEAIVFGERDDGADLVETSLLMQGLLIARAYFNGPGVEAELRECITALWEEVEWDWFANGEDNGLYWHWDPEHGFYHGLKILGYNECLITYVLAASSPTHPIDRKTYDYWTSGDNYGTRDVFGYSVEATAPGGGPLFLAHYSFIGLDPRRIADDKVRRGYFVRNVKQTLGNRGYCLYEAPPENRYSETFWGLSASQTKTGYAAGAPDNDTGTVAPTAALSSMPYTPHYSMQVLGGFRGSMRKRVWGDSGPYDGVSLRDDWVSGNYLAIDQLPMVCMVENYRSGLLWKLFMSDSDVQRGLDICGLREPALEPGFPEAVVALRNVDGKLLSDAYDIRRHPDTGLYHIPFHSGGAGVAAFSIEDADGDVDHAVEAAAVKGANTLRFPQFMPPDGEKRMLVMKMGEAEYRLPIRLH